jgi:hypothetical protein
LYGTKTTPTNLVDDKLIRPINQVTSVNVDKSAFMAGAGRFAVGAQFELIKKFFEPAILFGEYHTSIPVGTYTKQEINKIFVLPYFGWIMKQLDYQDDIDDYAERVYVYNSQEYKISDDAKFIVEADGTRRIENFSVEYRQDPSTPPENFDFVGGGNAAAVGNGFLQPRVDPSNIGRTVNINFTGSLPGVTYTKDSL